MKETVNRSLETRYLSTSIGARDSIGNLARADRMIQKIARSIVVATMGVAVGPEEAES